MAHTKDDERQGPSTAQPLRVLVTGGGIGIGREIANEFATAGHTVETTYLTHAPTQSDGRSGGADHRYHAERVDFRDDEAVREFVHHAVERMGGLDVLVNNVGGLLGRVPFAEMSASHWRSVIELNLNSAFYATSAAAPHIADFRGRVINIASLAAQTGGGAGSTAYAAAKAGLLGFTRGLSKELAHRRITVNAVAPGFIEATPFHDQFTPPQAQRESIQQIPLGRAGQVADVSSVVRWLASAQSSFITGACIDVNGGQWFT